MPVIDDPDALYGRLTKRGVDSVLARALAESLHEIPSSAASQVSLDKLDRKVDALDAKLSARIDGVESKLTAKIDAVDAKLTAKIDALSNALILRLGSLMVVLLTIFIAVDRYLQHH